MGTNGTFEVSRAKAAEKHAKRNQGVDLKQVHEALDAVGRLREQGFTGAGYNLASPYGRSVRHSANEGPWASA